jgi:hypothetical protein
MRDSMKRSRGRKAKGPRRLTVYIFRVSFRRRMGLYRTISIGANQTLEDLHYAIQAAFDWDADHLYSFFLSCKRWDRDTEYALMDDDFRADYDLPLSRDTRKAKIRGLQLEVGSRMLYLFDYGDNHEFIVELVSKGKQAVNNELPAIIDQRGRSPEQYPEVPE